MILSINRWTGLNAATRFVINATFQVMRTWGGGPMFIWISFGRHFMSCRLAFRALQWWSLWRMSGIAIVSRQSPLLPMLSEALQTQSPGNDTETNDHSGFYWSIESNRLSLWRHRLYDIERFCQQNKSLTTQIAGYLDVQSPEKWLTDRWPRCTRYVICGNQLAIVNV